MKRQVLKGLGLGNDTRVQFDASAIARLIEQAKAGVRVHELMSVTQLGDVCAYLEPTIECLNPAPDADRDDRNLPPEHDDDSPVTYEQFLERTRDSDVVNAWQEIVYGKAFREFIQDLLGEVVATQRALRESDDPLIRYELDRVDRHNHPRELALIEGGRELYDPARTLDITPVYGPGFYACLTDLAALPEVHSLSYCGSADYRTLRIACMERWRRDGVLESNDGTFGIHVLDMHNRWSLETTYDYDSGYRLALSSTPAWFKGIRFYSEGLGHGDVLVDDTVSRSNLQELIGRYWHGAILIATQPLETLHPEMEWHRHTEGFSVGLRKSAATERMRAACAQNHLVPVGSESP